MRQEPEFEADVSLRITSSAQEPQAFPICQAIQCEAVELYASRRSKDERLGVSSSGTAEQLIYLRNNSGENGQADAGGSRNERELDGIVNKRGSRVGVVEGNGELSRGTGGAVGRRIEESEELSGGTGGTGGRRLEELERDAVGPVEPLKQEISLLSDHPISHFQLGRTSEKVDLLPDNLISDIEVVYENAPQWIKALLPKVTVDGWWDVFSRNRGFVVRFCWSDQGRQTVIFPRISFEDFQAMKQRPVEQVEEYLRAYIRIHLHNLLSDSEKRLKALVTAEKLGIELAEHDVSLPLESIRYNSL